MGKDLLDVVMASFRFLGKPEPKHRVYFLPGMPRLLPQILSGGYFCHPHLTDVKTEVQRGSVTCSRSSS